MSVLRTSDLSKRFGKVQVLDGLNLDVPEGSIYGLIGANGVGKTTTIKVLMNILKPTSGDAEVLGVDSRKLSPGDLARIGYVSENQEMPDWMSIEYLLWYLKPFYPTWDDNRATELVRQFNLPLDRPLKHLSRGMRMKAMLTASLAYHPRLLVLDEPFSGLDAVVREDLSESLVESAGETTIFISSHDLGDMESFASHIGYLEGHHLQFSEEMATLIARFREVEILVEPPSTLTTSPEWPANWLRPQSTPAVIRFIESRFDPDKTRNEIRRRFGEVLNISFNPMPLRAIFVALARSTSGERA